MATTIRLFLCALALALLSAFSSGCAIAELFEPDPPRVNTPFANKARAVAAPGTPTEDTLSPQALFVWDEDGEEDDDDLEDLDDETGLRSVYVGLGAGLYEHDFAVTLRDMDELVFEGEGPDKTRVELQEDSLRSLLCKNIKKVVFRNLTVVGYYGGGLFFEGCPDVRIENVHFVGSSFGLEFKGSTATIVDSVFAGCAKGIGMRSADLTIRGSCFNDCYIGIKGEGDVHLSATAFVDNHTAIKASIGHRSEITSCLFVGAKQDIGWEGKPRVAASNIANHIAFNKHLDEQTNSPIDSLDDFPEHVRFPAGFDMPGVHLAYTRFKARGMANPHKALEDARYDGAERFAKVSQLALKGNDLASARQAAQLALRYWGDRPLTEAPKVLAEVAALGASDKKTSGK